MRSTKHPLLCATPGAHFDIVSHHYGPETAPRSVYIQAGLHADEVPGMLVSVVLMDRLKKLDAAGKLQCRVTLVPMCNPVGVGQHLLGKFVGRFDLSSGHNFNRSFPMLFEEIAKAIDGQLTADGVKNLAIIRAAWAAALRARVPVTQMDAFKQTLMLLAHDADIMLDLHCSLESPMHMYTGTAIWKEMEPLSRYLGAEASLLALDAGGDSFDEAHSYTWYLLQQRFGAEFPIPHGSLATTLEHRGQRDVSWELAQQDAEGILNYLTYMGYIAGTAPPLPPLPQPATPLEGAEYLLAPVSGVVVYRVQPGDYVHAGQVMFDIVDPVTGLRTPMAPTVDGVLFTSCTARFVQQGESVARIAGAQARRSGYLLSA